MTSDNGKMEASRPSGVIHICTLEIRCPASPSFKNSKRAILDRNTGRMRTLTPGPIKKRMDALEQSILSALYSSCPTIDGVTHSECLKRLRTVLCGLSDDSVREVPEGSWGVEYVPKDQEGLRIIIHKIL